MKKTLAGSIILMCLCMSSLAQTPEQSAAYKAAVQSQENVNRVQHEAGMPEMAVPTFEEWLKAEEDKEKIPASSGSTINKEDPKIKWAKKLETIQPQLCELKPVKDKSNPVSSAEAIKEKIACSKPQTRRLKSRLKSSANWMPLPPSMAFNAKGKMAKAKFRCWRENLMDIPYGLKAII
ncbi:MAG: hypothetical protein JXR23_09105 [Pontiellaceae bacterium]|nr:hypothetical protein [Pontiellaceae bacterium]